MSPTPSRFGPPPRSQPRPAPNRPRRPPPRTPGGPRPRPLLTRGRPRPEAREASRPTSNVPESSLYGGFRDVGLGGRPATAADREQIDPLELREHGPALRGAVEGMAGGEDETTVADGFDDPDVSRIDHLVLLDRVGEGCIGHLDPDLVTVLDLVDLPERGEIGGPVTGDRDRSGLAGDRCRPVVARALLQRR